jgi:hypothetical protein
MSFLVRKPEGPVSPEAIHADVEHVSATNNVTHSCLHKPTPEEIREQLERLIASRRFASSHRCQLLLRHVVETTLSGDAESLKERTIGVETLKRSPDYDTNSDPAVRVAAGEVRKKLAQYYYEPGKQDRVRIELPVGSYVPVFTLLDSASHDDGVVFAEETSGASQGLSAVAKSPVGKRTVIIGALAAGILVICATATTFHLFNSDAPLKSFWGSLVSAPNPVLICTGQMGTQHLGDSARAPGDDPSTVMVLGPNGTYPENPTTVILSDAVAMANIAGVLRSENKEFAIRSSAYTNFQDLQKGPAVLVGGFNNDWTIFFTRSMRYHFAGNSEGDQWIEDRNNPQAKIGMQNIRKEVYGPLEFALIARIFNTETKQPIILIAGVTPAGTMAAGTFVTSSQYLKEFEKAAPKGWETKNLEMLIRANVIGNQPGPPQLVGLAAW